MVKLTIREEFFSVSKSILKDCQVMISYSLNINKLPKDPNDLMNQIL